MQGEKTVFELCFIHQLHLKSSEWSVAEWNVLGALGCTKIEKCQERDKVKEREIERKRTRQTARKAIFTSGFI